jgi:hypothetical protein
MPRPMTRYKTIEKPKAPEHSFVDIRGGRKAYAKNGNLCTYSNRTQADNKVRQLCQLGFDCCRTFEWPFLIILN